MKKLSILFLFVFIIQTIIFSQCIPDSIVFSTQQQIDSFQADYPECTEILGTVEIHGDNITNVQGLSVLTSIGVDLRIYNNIALASLNGLDNLISIGEYFMLVDNPVLVSLTGLGSLTSVGANIDIWSNTMLSDLSGLDELTSIGGFLRIWQNTNLSSISNLSALNNLGGGLSIFHNGALSSLTGLESLESINGFLEIGSNDALNSLLGLDNITAIDGLLLIRNNDVLTDLSGLESLQTIGGELTISHNFLFESLTGLGQLYSVGGNLILTYDSLLTDLSALSNLTSIDGYIELRNNGSLVSLSGLDNVDASTIESLIIRNNVSLWECEVKSVCDFLSIPENETNFYNNGPACQTRTQVEDRCESLAVHEIRSLDHLNIYPNPCSNFAVIDFELKDDILVEISIYNQLGQQIDFATTDSFAGRRQFIWNTKVHKTGFYFVKVKAGNDISLRKFVIQH